MLYRKIMLLLITFSSCLTTSMVRADHETNVQNKIIIGKLKDISTGDIDGFIERYVNLEVFLEIINVNNSEQEEFFKRKAHEFVKSTILDSAIMDHNKVIEISYKSAIPYLGELYCNKYDRYNKKQIVKYLGKSLSINKDILSLNRLQIALIDKRIEEIDQRIGVIDSGIDPVILDLFNALKGKNKDKTNTEIIESRVTALKLLAKNIDEGVKKRKTMKFDNENCDVKVYMYQDENDRNLAGVSILNASGIDEVILVENYQKKISTGLLMKSVESSIKEMNDGGLSVLDYARFQ